MQELTDFQRKAAKAAADFHAAQQTFFVEYRKDEQRKCDAEAQNTFVVKLRRRLLAIYETDTVPEANRLQAYALWHAAKPYIWKRNTLWPMVETDLRPAFPEVSEHAILYGIGNAHHEDAERRCGWLYRTEEWVVRVEAKCAIIPVPGEDI